MAITVTVMKEDGRCKFYVDDFENSNPVKKFAQTANPLTFSRRALFTSDIGNEVFDLPLEDAKEMAREILKLGE